MLGFPARLLSGLPVPVRLDLIDDAGRPVVVDTGPSSEDLRARGEATVLDGPEWAALAEAAESDRLWPGDLEILVGTRGPGRITIEAALSGARGEPPLGWSVARVLERLGQHPAPALAVREAAANEEHLERRAA